MNKRYKYSVVENFTTNIYIYIYISLSVFFAFLLCGVIFKQNVKAISSYSLSFSTDNANINANIDALPEPKNIAQIQNMQEMNPSICQNMAIHQTATLTDTRDNETYTITKLKDTRC